jgi:two-component sensor histidine kinase
MQSYFEDLTKALSDTFLEENEQFDCTITCFDIRFSLEKVVPLGLIANEAISNAMKYGKSGKHKLQIEVKLFAEEGLYKLQISDKGKGYPDGLNIQNLNSLGLELISILTEQLNGTWEHKNQGGAYICIKFPKNE